jgi:hypothetical protein
MKANYRVALVLGLLGAWFVGLRVAAGESDAAWQKVDTEEQVLKDVQQILTPGLFDTSGVAKVAFPVDGTAVELNLPHEGAGADGKARSVLKAALRQRAIWVDLDGDGKPGGKELSAIGPEGDTGPFAYMASYADGTSGVYTFKLQATKTVGEFRIVRLCARVARPTKQNTVVVIDDNGNGLFNDLGRDAILIDAQPVTFLGRQIYIGDQLFELVVHPGGKTIEIRPMAHYQTGKVNLFKEFTYPQKAENLRIHMVIAQGTDAAFGFSAQQPVRDLPVGAYDLVFALFERSTERVYMLKGDKTSFAVEANKEVSVKWGGPVEAQFTVTSAGHEITLSPPTFTGQAGELYVPSDLRKIPFHGYLSAFLKDRRGNPTDRTDSRATDKYSYDANGDLKPLVFDYRKSDELQVAIEYRSGILGSVRAEKKLSFTVRR